MGADQEAVAAVGGKQPQPVRSDRGIVPFIRVDRRRAVEFIGSEDAAAAPVRAGGQAILLLEIAAIGRRPQPRPGLDPVEITAQDDVSNAAHGIRAVKRGRPVRDHLDAIERAERDDRDIDRLARAAIGQAVPVEQSQRRVAAEPAQVERRPAANVDTAGGGHIEPEPRILAAAKALRQAASDLAETPLPLVARLFARDRDDG